MESISTSGYTYLNLKNRYGVITNEQYFLIAKSGYGKGLGTGGLVQSLFDEGYIPIIIADPKDESEFAFSMFEPEARYHLNELRRTGIKPNAVPCKLYHPFTFRLPKRPLPDMNIFTIPIKNLTADEYAFLAETDSQNESVRFLINAGESIPDSGGLYTFLHKIQELAKGKKTGKTVKATATSRYLEVTFGTSKSVTESLSIMQPFFIDYFLSSKSSPLALDFKQILSDNKHYHVFLANYMPYKKNKKVRDFLVLSLVSQIISNVRYAKHPIVLVIPEVGNQMPLRPEGHEKFLAKSLRRLITTCRSMGKGISTVSDSQTYSGIDEEYANSSTVLFLGQLAGTRDVEKVVKSLGYKQELRKRLLQPTYPNSFTYVGHEDEEYYLKFPSHRWAEAHYSFEELYANLRKDDMKDYSDIINNTNRELKSEEEKFRDKVKKKEEAEKKEREARKKKKEDSGDDTVDKKMDKAKEIQDKAKGVIMKQVWMFKQNNPEISFNRLGKEFGIDRKTAKRYYEKVDAEEQTKDFEDEFDDALQEHSSDES